MRSRVYWHQQLFIIQMGHTVQSFGFGFDLKGPIAIPNTMSSKFEKLNKTKHNGETKANHKEMIKNFKSILKLKHYTYKRIH